MSDWNYYAPDGHRYGVMFSDGSIRNCWNGRTQRQRAQEEADELAVRYFPDLITLARQRADGGWMRVFLDSGVDRLVGADDPPAGDH